MKKPALITLLVLVGGFIVFNYAYAETYTISFENPTNATDFLDLINIIATWLFNLAIPVAVALIIWSGYTFMTAGADSAKVKKARDILTWVVVGLAIVFINKGFMSLIRDIIELGN